MAISTHGSNELKAILASVYYLSSEANKAGLNYVSNLFKTLISDLEQHLLKEKNSKEALLEEVLESDLYTILVLLDKFSKINKFDIKGIIQAIELYGHSKAKSH